MREFESVLPNNDQSDDLAFVFALNARFSYHKSNLERENDEFFDDFLNNLRRFFKIYSEKKVADPVISLIITENLPSYIGLMMDRKYISSSELPIQVKTNEFLQETLSFCLENVSQQPVFFDLLRRVLNFKASIYSIYSLRTFPTNYEKEFRSLVFEELQKLHKPQPKTQEIPNSEPVLVENQAILTEVFLREEEKDANFQEVAAQANDFPQNFENSPFFPSETKLKPKVFEEISLSPFVVLNLISFEKSQGFQKLMDLIRGNSSASNIIAILDFFETLWTFFEKDYLLGFLSQVLDDIKAIPQKINEDEIKNSKKTEISELLHTIEFVYEKFFSAKELKRFIEIMELELYLMCFKSQYLEKRIFGLSNIISKVRESSVNKRIETNYQYKILINNVNFNSYYKNGKESDLWLTPQNMLEWVEKEQLFNILFGESMHVELISRALPLIKFLYENNAITNERLDLIFELSHGKHEAFRNPVAKILLELIEIMNLNDLSELFEKIKSIAIAEITPEMLLMLKHMIASNSNLLREKRPKEENKMNETKEFEMKEIKPNKANISDFDELSNENIFKNEEKITNFSHSTIKICKNVQVSENFERNREFEQEFEENKQEENIKELRFLNEDSNNNEVMPLIITHNGDNEQNLDNLHNTNENNLINKAKEQENINQNLAKLFEFEVLNHIWNIATASNNQFPKHIVSEALKYITEILSKSFTEKKMEFIQRCIENISANTSIHESLQILESIIKGNFPIKKSDTSLVICNKLEFVELLEKDYSLTNEILSSIILLKKSFVSYMLNLHGNDLNLPNELADLDRLDKPIEESLSLPAIQKPEDFEKEKKPFPKTIPFQSKAQPTSSRKKSVNPSHENVSEEEKFNFSGPANTKDCETEAKSIDLTQPTRADKETLSISTDVSSFDELNMLFEKNNLLFDNEYSNKNNEQTMYLKEIEIRLKFLRSLFEISLEMLEVKHINILWEVLVMNAVNEQEKDLFFNFFNSIIYSTKDKYRRMKEEVICYIYFDILLKIEHSCYNLKAFFCFEAFFFFINKEAKLITLSDFDTYKLHDPELIGLEHVWELYLQANDRQVSMKAGDLLIKIFKFAAKDDSNTVFEALKQNFLETLINYIKIGYLELQDLPLTENNENKTYMILQSLSLILKLIEESEGSKSSAQGSKSGESLQITIMNQLSNAMNPKKFDISLNSRMTLSQAKALISKKLNPPQKPEDILFMVRGSLLLEDQKSLQELRLESKLTIFVTKASFQDEEFQQQSSENYQISNELLQAKISELKEMFSGFSEDLLKFILEKKKFNENEVAMVLLDEKTCEEYKEEFQRIEKEKLKEKQKMLGLEKEESDKNNISYILANRPDYFGLFFDILNLEIPKLTTKTWTLLNHIPINRELMGNIKNIFIRHRLNNEKIEWGKIFNPKQPYKTLYALQIVHSIIACGVLDEKEQMQEINERKEWREKFIEFNGFNSLYKLLINSNIIEMVRPLDKSFKDKIEEPTATLLTRYLYYIIEILKVYIHSFLISTIPETMQKYLNQAIRFKENFKETAPSNESTSQGGGAAKTSNTTVCHTIKFQTSHPQSLSNSYSMTPNFHSPITSKSATPHCTTPPIIDKDGDNVSLNKSSIFNNTKDNSVLYDEFIGFTKHSIEKLNDKLRSAINFEHLIEKLLQIIEETIQQKYTDCDSICLIENCFEVLFPSLIGKPELLLLVYNFPKIENIFSKILISMPNETLRKTITHILNTISLYFQEPVFKEKLHEINTFKSQRILEKEHATDNLLENFIDASFENLENFDENESFGNPNNEENNEDVEGLIYEGNSFEKKPANNEKIMLEEPRVFFLRLLIPQILNMKFEKYTSSINNSSTNIAKNTHNNEDFEDFFICLSMIMKQNTKEEVCKIVNLQELFEKICFTIIDREVLEDRYKEDEDKVLAGFMMLAKTLIEIEPNFKLIRFKEYNGMGLIHYIYDFMFFNENELNLQDLNIPKCKKKNTRKRGFELLLELCNKCEENFMVLLPSITKSHENFQAIDYDSCNCDLKSTHGFIGLRNLGCTCYINSLIQQFYMIKELRYCILHCKGMSGETNENVLCQLQLLFANLKENIKKFLVPNQLISSLKGYDNQAIDVHIQQDVNEFFNLLSDKLENHLKDTQYSTLLQDIIGGSLSHEIISLEDEFSYHGEREEPFYSISIEIKHKKNLAEALDYYVKGETLEGDNKYFCEQYNRKIKALKRCLIKKLPNTLIVTLKRFEFDFNSMQKVKVNDYFEFPRNINMKKWTKDGQNESELNNEDDKNYLYELVGVLVHSGTSEAGHYYSYIRDRENPIENWYEFNDTHVTLFNIINLGNECFGGEYEKDIGMQHFADWDGSKSKNAYLLFYEKVNQQITPLIKSTENIVPYDLKENIRNQNVNYLKCRLFYDVDYFNFIKAFICLYDFQNQLEVKPIISFSLEQLKDIRWMIDNQDLLSLTKQAQFSDNEDLTYQLPEEEMKKNLENLNSNSLDYWVQTPALQTIKLAITFAHDSFIKTKDIQGYLGWMIILKPLFENYVPSCFWFLNYAVEKKEMLKEVFFEITYVEAKTAFSKLLIIIINNVFKREDEYLFEKEIIEKLEISNDYYSMIKRIEFKKACLIRFIDYFCTDLLVECKKSLPKSLDYLQIIKYLIQLSPKIIFYIVQSKILKNFMDIFLANAPSNSYYSYQPMVIKMNDKITENHLIPLLDIISLVIRGCLTEGIQRSQALAPTSLPIDKEYFTMIDPCVEESFVDQSNYLSIFFPMQQFSESTAFITKHLSWGDLKNSKFFLSMLRDILTSIQTSWNQVEQIFRVVDGILKLEDFFQKERIQYFFEDGKYYNISMNILDHLTKMRENDKMFTIMCIKCIAEIGSGCPACANYIRENSKKFKWMVEYIQIVQKQSTFIPQTPHLPRVLTTALNKLIEILGLNAMEQENLPVEINIDVNGSENSENEEKNHQIYLDHIEKKQLGPSDEMEIEEEKNSVEEKYYKKKQQENDIEDQYNFN